MRNYTKTLNTKRQLYMDREQLIQYIGQHDKFYESTLFLAHSYEQLIAIKKRIDSTKTKKSKVSNHMIKNN